MPSLILLDDDTVLRVKEHKDTVRAHAESQFAFEVTILEVEVPAHPVHELGVIDVYSSHIVTVKQTEDGSAQDTGR